MLQQTWLRATAGEAQWGPTHAARPRPTGPCLVSSSTPGRSASRKRRTAANQLSSSGSLKKSLVAAGHGRATTSGHNPVLEPGGRAGPGGQQASDRAGASGALRPFPSHPSIRHVLGLALALAGLPWKAFSADAVRSALPCGEARVVRSSPVSSLRLWPHLRPRALWYAAAWPGAPVFAAPARQPHCGPALCRARLPGAMQQRRARG